MNDMCKNCACLNVDCKGTNETAWTGCVYKKTKHILGSFKWETGSINDNIRKILRNKGLKYINTFNGDVLVNNIKIEHEHINGDLYNVFIV
jgi:hypothetical protein